MMVPKRLFSRTLWFILFTNFCHISSCKKESAGTEPIVVKRYFGFDSSSAHDLEVSGEGTHQYKILTTGSDPYILLNPLKTNKADEKPVFTFEYQSTANINSLQVFFGPPVTEERSVKSGELASSERWKVFSYDLGDFTSEFSWGKAGHYLRLDFGNLSGLTIRIRNMEFRERTADEQALADARAEERTKTRILEEKLNKYFASDFSASLSKVSVSTSKITVSGNCPDPNNLFLCEVKPFQDLVQMAKFGDGVAIENQNFSIELDRYVEKDGFTYDQGLSKWVIVKQASAIDEMISFARYADEFSPVQMMPIGQLRSKKGLGGFDVSRGFQQDLDDLQITSVTVNVPLTAYMYLHPRANTFEYIYGGKTYYFDRARIEDLDRTLLKAYGKDIVVAAIILIQKASECADPEIGELLQHPGYTSGGFFTMPNMTNPAGLNCYAAALDFLASRYNRSDNAHGRIHHWIMHNEVDAGSTWTNMGDVPMLVFMDTYIKSMRLCYNIIRNYDGSGQVFGSFTHSWKEAEEDYATLEMLDVLNKECKTEGDFSWGLACHPYPQDLNEPKTWNDTRAIFSMDSPLVTFKNLEVLDAWIKKPENKFKGSVKRSLWLSENGTNSKTYNGQDLKEQAAGLAYAWKKIKALDGIDAIQWHNWIDNRNEFGLRIGLRCFPDDEEQPGAPKPVWYVYQAAGTDQENGVFEEYKSIIGISNWSEIMRQVP
jgi:hypothetical protein